MNNTGKSKVKTLLDIEKITYFIKNIKGISLFPNPGFYNKQDTSTKILWSRTHRDNHKEKKYLKLYARNAVFQEINILFWLQNVFESKFHLVVELEYW